MEEILRKKINLLIHLAKSDGKFHASEKAILLELLKEKGVENFNFENVDFGSNPLKELSTTNDREELLYWALLLIRADGIIHPDEIAYCKALALKLKVDPTVIDLYSGRPLPSFEIFSNELMRYSL